MNVKLARVSPSLTVRVRVCVQKMLSCCRILISIPIPIHIWTSYFLWSLYLIACALPYDHNNFHERNWKKKTEWKTCANTVCGDVVVVAANINWRKGAHTYMLYVHIHSHTKFARHVCAICCPLAIVTIKSYRSVGTHTCIHITHITVIDGKMIDWAFGRLNLIHHRRCCQYINARCVCVCAHFFGLINWVMRFNKAFNIRGLNLNTILRMYLFQSFLARF